MKVTSLQVSNLLSFDDFRLDFDDHLTVVVGPNGAGKSNLVRVLDLVTKLVDWADERSRSGAAPPTPADAVLSSYVQARHDGSGPGTPMEVCLGVEFAAPSERSRIVSFVRAAVLATLAEESHAGDEERKSRLAGWVAAEIDEEKLAPLFSGSLRFRHPGYDEALWEGRYEFSVNGALYDWILYTPNFWASVVAHNAVVSPSTQETRLSEALLGMSAQVSPPQPLPDPLPPFTFDTLCPPADMRLANLVVRLGTGSVNELHEPFRTAAAQMGFRASGAMGQQAFGFARALRFCLNEGMITLGEQFRGLGIGGTVPWRAGIYPWELIAGPAPARDPGFLPLRLFRLKNGPTAGDRELFEQIRREFEGLAPGRSFDVTFTATQSFIGASTPIGAGQVSVAGMEAVDGNQGEPAGIVTVVGWNKAGTQRRERPIQLFGAGTWEALVLAEALASCDERFMVLDEPASTLHPTWQTALRNRLRTKIAGQMVLVTHSPSLVPIESPADLARIARISNEDGASRVHRLPSGIATSEAFHLIRALSLSADARSLLFCHGAVIVSGDTELGALPVWCAKSATAAKVGSPADLDIEFHSAGGDKGFGGVLKVLQPFGVPWVLVCDGLSFEVTGASPIVPQLCSAEIDIPELAQSDERARQTATAHGGMTQQPWDEVAGCARRHGVFTFSTTWTGIDESFEGFLERVVPGKLAEAADQVGKKSKIRKGMWVADHTPCPDEVDAFYGEAVTRLVGSSFDEVGNDSASPSHPKSTVPR
ncbi:MAG: AAA family ATPase [Acidimicrobiales bacterium]